MQLFGYGALCLRDYSFPKNCARYAITVPDILLVLLERILVSNGFVDACMALSAVDGHRNALRLYACFCARRCSGCMR
jgi:hypothetical protein